MFHAERVHAPSPLLAYSCHSPSHHLLGKVQHGPVTAGALPLPVGPRASSVGPAGLDLVRLCWPQAGVRRRLLRSWPSASMSVQQPPRRMLVHWQCTRVLRHHVGTDQRRPGGLLVLQPLRQAGAVVVDEVGRRFRRMRTLWRRL